MNNKWKGAIWREKDLKGGEIVEQRWYEGKRRNKLRKGVEGLRRDGKIGQNRVCWEG